MIHFMYKLNIVTGVGGISIPTIEGINGGQGCFREWLLGTADDIQLLDRIREFNPIVISEDVRNGLMYVDITEITEVTALETITRPLNETELALQATAQNYLYKMNARRKIETDVADIPDLIADISKKLDFIVRLASRMFGDWSGAYPMEPEIKATYMAMIQQFLGAVDNSLYTCRADLEDQNVLFGKLMQSDIQVADIVKTEYLDKKR